MSLINRLGLKYKIMTLSLSLVMILAAVTWFCLNRIAVVYRQSYIEKMKSPPQVLGEKIKAQFYERYGDVQAFAVNNSVQTMSFDEMKADLDQYVNLYGIYDLILVVDTNGNYVGSNSKDVSGVSVQIEELKKKNFKDTPWFKAAIAGQFSEDKQSGFLGTYFEPMILDPLMDTAFGNKHKFTSGFTAQVKNQKGEVIGVITNRANTKWFENEFTSYYENLKSEGQASAEMYWMNTDGTILFQHVPYDTEKKNIVVHDEEILLKKKFSEIQTVVFDKMKNSENDSLLSRDLERGTEDMVGFYKMHGDKWISDLGGYVVISTDFSTALGAVKEIMDVFYILLTVIVLMSAVASYLFSDLLAKKINNINKKLNENARSLDEQALTLNKDSQKLSSSSSQQSSAIQQTVASVDQISAMVEKNTEGAQKSQQMSQESKEAAELGRERVENMIHSISEIEQVNDQISNQMNENNQKISEIVSLINDIGQKTKVINEIVFQTKLLSFNASVEAARAGEAGKGFAVVAEEVGQLAQMSGNASKEITDLLNESTRKVELIVNESKSRVEEILNMSKEKVQAGTATAHECGQALQNIIDMVQNLDLVIAEIATASKEQSMGIREISKAMGQLESVTQENAIVAKSTSSTADLLKLRSDDMQESIGSLDEFIRGDQALNNETDHKENFADVINLQKNSKQTAEYTDMVEKVKRA